MYIIPIAWIYVVLMMSVAEATNTNGTVLGAVITFLLYGVLPVALIVYFMTTPARKRAIRARQAQEQAEWQAAQRPSDAGDALQTDATLQPDTGGHAPADAVAPVGKIP